MEPCRRSASSYARRSRTDQLGYCGIMDDCTHAKVVCLNQYELIRKYRCSTCGGVMMCACDETRGPAVVPHQLREGTEYGTRTRVPVTLSFQSRVCPECRGLPAVVAPKASMPGA